MTEKSATNFIGSEIGSPDPTWVARLSADVLDAGEIADIIAFVSRDYGATIERGYGVWQGAKEQAVSITMQAPAFELEKVLLAIANRIDSLRWVHVEKHEPDTEYVDLDAIRAYYNNTSAAARS